jgi:hypothetical protein
MLRNAAWRNVHIKEHDSGKWIRYSLASLGRVRLTSEVRGLLFAAQIGAIEGSHRGTVFGLSNVENVSLCELVEHIGWARWIRRYTRREEKRRDSGTPGNAVKSVRTNLKSLEFRSNITSARRRDAAFSWMQEELSFDGKGRRHVNARGKTLNVVELFAGAGGMGLGFLLASTAEKRYRLVLSAEIHPIYVETLRQNHVELGKLSSTARDLIPHNFEPIDLGSRHAPQIVDERIRSSGGVDILVAGPADRRRPRFEGHTQESEGGRATQRESRSGPHSPSRRRRLVFQAV